MTASALLARLAEAESDMAAALLKIVELLRRDLPGALTAESTPGFGRALAGQPRRSPRQTTLQAIRRQWVQMPAFGSLGGLAVDLRHRRLEMSERRACVGSYSPGGDWQRRDLGPPALAVVRLTLTAKPGAVRFGNTLVRLLPLPAIVAWFADRPGASGDDLLAALAGEVAG